MKPLVRNVSEDSEGRKRFYNVAEAAQLLGLSEPTLYRAIRDGAFPAVKIRGRYVVPAKAIDELESSALSDGLVDAATRSSGLSG